MKKLNKYEFLAACMASLLAAVIIQIISSNPLSAQETASHQERLFKPHNEGPIPPTPPSTTNDIEIERSSAPPRRRHRPERRIEKNDLTLHVRLNPPPEEGEYPYVEVQLDGNLVASLEHESETTISVSVGSHRLTLSSEGYQSLEREITVNSGRDHKFEFSLKKPEDKPSH
jgi:hypothetical protein